MTNKPITPPMLLCDFYKTSHKPLFPKGTNKVFTTLVARSNKYFPIAKDGAVVFYVQALVKKYFINYFNKYFFDRPKVAVLKEYERYMKFALGQENPDIEHIAQLHDLGYLPVELKALPEGTVAPIQVPILTIENTHDDFYWLPNWFETIVTNEIWLPITSATFAHELRKMLDEFAIKTTGSTDGVEFQAHDFSMRGMSSLESAMASGAGHLLPFVGTDTIPAIAALEEYYLANMENELIATSIPASEHSVMTALTPTDGDRDEYEAFKHIINNVYPTGFVSIVADSYDFFKVVEETLPKLKEDIMKRDGKVVIRPDCYDEETQIFTNSGWKFFKDLTKEDLVAQVLDDGTYEFVKPLKYISQHYNGEMIKYKSKSGNIDLLVTPNHRMIGYKSKTDVEVVEEAKDFDFVHRKSLKGNGACELYESNKSNLSELEILSIILQADGYIPERGNYIKFEFKKDRKINRLLNYCQKFGWVHKVSKTSRGTTSIQIELSKDLRHKTFTTWIEKDMSKISKQWALSFIEEIKHWDGQSEIGNGHTIRYFSNDEESCKIVENIATVAGYSSTYLKSKDGVIKIAINKKNYVAPFAESVKSKVQYDGSIYCVQVPSGRLLIKRNRCTLVCGNSGDPVNILVGKEIEVIEKDKYVKSLEDAKEVMEDIITDRIREETEHGEHGESYPSGEFYFDGKYYRMVVNIFWNRYDKQYYYVDGSEVESFEEFTPSAEDLGLIESLWNTFGGTVTEQGYKLLDSHIGAIYGDSITYERAQEICQRLKDKGFASLNVVFGIGAYSYQYKTRDSLGLATKATYAEINGEPIMLMKDPKTDSGKKSQRGKVAVINVDGNLLCKDGLTQSTYEDKYAEADELEVVFRNGELMRNDSLKQIRLRLLSQRDR